MDIFINDKPAGLDKDGNPIPEIYQTVDTKVKLLTNIMYYLIINFIHILQFRLQGYYIDPPKKSRAYVQFNKLQKTLYQAKGYNKAEALAAKKDKTIFELDQRLQKKGNNINVLPARVRNRQSLF